MSRVWGLYSVMFGMYYVSVRRVCTMCAVLRMGQYSYVYSVCCVENRYCVVIGYVLG